MPPNRHISRSQWDLYPIPLEAQTHTMVPVGYADPAKALPELSAKLRTCTSLGYFAPIKQPTWPGANCIPVWQDCWYVRWLSSCQRLSAVCAACRSSALA